MTSNCVKPLYLVINKAKGYINGHDRKNVYYFHSVKSVHIWSFFFGLYLEKTLYLDIFHAVLILIKTKIN